MQYTNVVQLHRKVHIKITVKCLLMAIIKSDCTLYYNRLRTHKSRIIYCCISTKIYYITLLRSHMIFPLLFLYTRQSA